MRVYKVSDDVLKQRLPRDRISTDRLACRERADPTFLTHGPKTGPEFLHLLAWIGQPVR